MSRCRDCKALIQYEWDLCEECHAEWIGWLQKRDKETTDVPVQR